MLAERAINLVSPIKYTPSSLFIRPPCGSFQAQRVSWGGWRGWKGHTHDLVSLLLPPLGALVFSHGNRLWPTSTERVCTGTMLGWSQNWREPRSGFQKGLEAEGPWGVSCKNPKAGLLGLPTLGLTGSNLSRFLHHSEGGWNPQEKAAEGLRGGSVPRPGPKVGPSLEGRHAAHPAGLARPGSESGSC